METRLLVERFALEQVAEGRVDLANDLAEAIADQEKLATEQDPIRFVEADREFHRIFMASAGNPILLELVDSLRDRQSRMGVAAIAREKGRMEAIIVEHHELADAVVQGDGDRAAKVLERHLAGALKTLRRSN
jgi:DNA-binding GntR family transcriptional regulator